MNFQGAACEQKRVTLAEVESSLPNIQHRHQSRPFLDSQRGLLISIFQSRYDMRDVLGSSSCFNCCTICGCYRGRKRELTVGREPD